MASVSNVISKQWIFLSTSLFYLYIDGSRTSGPYEQSIGSYCLKLGAAVSEVLIVSRVSIGLNFMWIEILIFACIISEIKSC